jgi:hypothetical protein
MDAMEKNILPLLEIETQFLGHLTHVLSLNRLSYPSFQVIGKYGEVHMLGNENNN